MISNTGLSPSMAERSGSFSYHHSITLSSVLLPRLARCHAVGLGSYAFARHYLRNHCCFLFLRVMRCFSSPGSPLAWQGAATACGGLPHSEIRGLTGICPSPRLIAACHVLRRLREPRHPSCAFFSFPFFLCGKSPFLFISLVRSLHTSLAASLPRLAAEPRGNGYLLKVCASLVRLLFELVFYFCVTKICSFALHLPLCYIKYAERYLRLPSCQCPLFQCSPWQS